MVPARQPRPSPWNLCEGEYSKNGTKIQYAYVGDNVSQFLLRNKDNLRTFQDLDTILGTLMLLNMPRILAVPLLPKQQEFSYQQAIFPW